MDLSTIKNLHTFIAFISCFETQMRSGRNAGERFVSYLSRNKFAINRSRSSAHERSNFSSLESIACISLGKFVNNHVKRRDILRRVCLYYTRCRFRALECKFGKGKSEYCRDNVFIRGISFCFRQQNLQASYPVSTVPMTVASILPRE